jgi:hypothetical protein
MVFPSGMAEQRLSINVCTESRTGHEISLLDTFCLQVYETKKKVTFDSWNLGRLEIFLKANALT